MRVEGQRSGLLLAVDRSERPGLLSKWPKSKCHFQDLNRRCIKMFTQGCEEAAEFYCLFMCFLKMSDDGWKCHLRKNDKLLAFCLVSVCPNKQIK